MTAAVAICLLRQGADVLVAESGGGPLQYIYHEGTFRACSHTEAAENTVFVIQRVRARQCSCRRESAAQLTVTEPFVQPRETLVIDIAKLKTHGMMGYSGAVKNLFGVVPGLLKPELHSRYPEKRAVAEMLVDLCEYVHGFLDYRCDRRHGGRWTYGRPKRFVGALVGLKPYEADMVG